MMKKFYYSISIAALLAMAACTKETPDWTNSKTTTIGATLEQSAPESKTSLSQTNAVLWSADDAVSVIYPHDPSFINEKFTIASGVGETTATFTGRDLETSEIYYALYPYSADTKITEGGIELNIPTSQTYVENSFANNANPSVSAFAFSTRNNLQFKNLFGVLKLVLKDGRDQSAEGVITVNGLRLTAAYYNDFLSGAITIDRESILASEPVFSFVSGSTTVDLNIPGDGVELSREQETAFYIVVPAGALSKGFKATIYDTVSGLEYEAFTFKDNTIKRSTVRVMPTIALSVPSEQREILSFGETANCYVIQSSETKKYTFYAKSRGNEGLDASTIAPKSAKLLWSTYCTTNTPGENSIIKDVALNHNGTMINFTATGVAGNAVIAAYSGENGTGTIVWSWHIWCAPGYDSTNSLIGPFYNNAYLLDRNLGALSDDRSSTLTYGLYYQWGRKDPFPRADHKAWNVTFTADTNVPATALESVAKPTHYFTKGLEGDWLSEHDNTLWNNDTKTMYDPCPIGYKVPPRDVLSVFKSRFDEANGMIVSTIDYIDLGWFPVSKIIASGGYAMQYDNGAYICGASPRSDMYGAYVCILKTSTAPSINDGNSRAFGIPVRCQKMN